MHTLFRLAPVALLLSLGLACSAQQATTAPLPPVAAIPARDMPWPHTAEWNNDWLFAPPPTDAKAPQPENLPKGDQVQWTKVTLPHTWNAKDTLETQKYLKGIGWYRKQLTFTQAQVDQDQQWLLRFGAVGQQAQVFLNGNLIGEHAGGYSAFTVHLTGLLKVGDNQIAVRVDNRTTHDLIPTTDGLFNIYGGIYRPVQLVSAPRICFDRNDHGGPGVRVWSEKVSAAQSDVQVQALISDASSTENLGNYSVQAQLTDPVGRVVSEQSAPASANLRLSLPCVSHPQLWSPEHPALYTLTLRLLNKEGKETDRTTVHHGFRFYRFTPDHGFFLNGAPYKLHGVNRHQDYFGLGNALHLAQHAQDLRLMKEMGVNWLRLAHYQQDDYVLQLCDQLGIFVWEEIPMVRSVSLTPIFERNAQSMLTEMITQHFNHPAVLLWGMGNEIYYHQAPDGRATNFGMISRLNDTIHRLDPVRKSVIVNGDATNASRLGIFNIPDVIGYNIYKGWYGGRVERLQARLDVLHALNPNKPMILSEFGAGAKLGDHSDKPKAWDMSEEYQVIFLKGSLQQLDANPWICGYNWWNYADFGWAQSSNPKLYNNKGLVTFDRQPKASFFFLREHLTGVKAPKAQVKPKNNADEGALPTGKDANPFEDNLKK